MAFSYAHSLMLSVISFFTAMLAPSVQSTSNSLPYAMTNLDFLAYSFLAFNTVIFLLAGFKFKKLTNILGICILIHVVGFLILTLGGFIQSHRGEYMSSLSWGWAFFLIGCIALIYALRSHKKYSEQYFSSMFDTIISICGAMVLIAISGVIIYISQLNAYKSTHILERIFEKEDLQTQSGVTLSPAFEAIYNFDFIRKSDTLSFIAKTSTGYIQYPEKENFSEFPQETLMTEDGEFFIKVHTSSQELYKGNTFHSTIFKKGESAILSVDSNENIYIFTKSGSIERLDPSYKDPRNIQEKNEKMYSIVSSGSGDILLENTTPKSEKYSHIRNYFIHPKNGDIIIFGKKENEKNYEIYKNNTKIKTVENFIAGSLKSDGKNLWYTKKNDDNSFSVFFNNDTLPKSYDSIEASFLQADDDGYVFFAKYPGKTDICVISRYQGEKCGFEKILSPQIEADGNGVIFLGREDDSWKIYRNTREIISEKSLPYTAENRLLFFFDTTHPEYFAIIKKDENGYQINKRGKILPQVWKNIGSEPFFGYDGKILIEIEDENGWRIAEL